MKDNFKINHYGDLKTMNDSEEVIIVKACYFTKSNRKKLDVLQLVKSWIEKEEQALGRLKEKGCIKVI